MGPGIKGCGGVRLAPSPTAAPPAMNHGTALRTALQLFHWPWSGMTDANQHQLTSLHMQRHPPVWVCRGRWATLGGGACPAPSVGREGETPVGMGQPKEGEGGHRRWL
uniref:Uncharacterized protein n=1 Tax=Eutreptiella gymnastica TaxID=73025 RepID=A0A7S1HYV2_9EUGL